MGGYRAVTPAAMMAQALAHHRAGQFADAERLCRHILVVEPGNAGALHLLGMLALRAGRVGLALEYVGRAVALEPGVAGFRCNLGLVHQNAGQTDQALECFREALRIQPEYPEAQNNLGAVLKARGDAAGAEAAFREALRLRPAFAEARSNLGHLLMERGAVEEALVALREAVRLKPEMAEAHFNLALVYGAMGEAALQVDCLREAVRRRPGYGEACNLLGIVLARQGRPLEAFEALGAGLRLRPEDAAARYQYRKVARALGKPEEPPVPLPAGDEAAGLPAAKEAFRRAEVWLREGRVGEAAAAYQEVLGLRPGFGPAYQGLGNTYLKAGRALEAVEVFRRGLAAHPEHPHLLNDLGNALQQVYKTDEAVSCYLRALHVRPNHLQAHANLGVIFKDQGRIEEAARHFDAALAVQRMPVLQVLRATLLPPVYGSAGEVDEWRRRLVGNLERLHEEKVQLDPRREVGPNLFYLAYQGRNDRAVQRRLAELYGPGFAVRPRRRDGKIRVAIVSKYLRDHTIGLLMRGLVARLSRKEFEVAAVTFGNPRDWVADFVRGHADQWLCLPEDAGAVARAVGEWGPDVLLYADIGMDPFTYSLAFSRLAPVQCVTWGHPVTSGISAIDYFLSSELVEPEGAEGHYTERLVRLKTLPFYYYRPTAPGGAAGREQFGLPADRHVYACLQTLFKFHPDFDEILGGILRRDPHGIVVLLRGKYRHWEEALRSRLARTVPDVVERVQFLPGQPREDFLRLMEASDVLLDTAHFSGGNTSYEGLALGVPIVTLPGEFMRGRLTYGQYRKMGVTDCIAETAADYVRIAVQLGTDPDYREEVRQRIRAAASVLFEDRGAVEEIEEFFRSVVSGGTAWGKIVAREEPRHDEPDGRSGPVECP